jgi:hypothetical protein
VDHPEDELSVDSEGIQRPGQLAYVDPDSTEPPPSLVMRSEPRSKLALAIRLS